MFDTFTRLICHLWLAINLLTLPPFARAEDLSPATITLSPWPAGGDFQLFSTQGPASLTDFRGKVVLLFFGYTSCPDVCPTTLANLSSTLGLLSTAERAQVEILMVSLDPERDTPQHLAAYLSHFSLPATGLTGSAGEIDRLTEAYAAQYARVELPGSALAYGIDHSAAVYLIDPAGNLRHLLRHAAAPALCAAAIRRHLPKM